MSNLVVFRQHEPGTRVDFGEPISVVPLDEVMRRHPSRAIVIHHSPGDRTMRAPIAAAVTVVILCADGVRYGVEQIAVRSACAAASLPSIVRNLARGDVPTSIWWVDDLSHTALLPTVVEMGRQLIYDSRMWRDIRRGVLALAPLIERTHAPDFADLNWRRLTPLRQALVHAAETIAPGTLAPNEARIAHRAGDEPLAWLLGGWLSSRPGNDSKADIQIHVEETARDDEILTLSFAAMAASMNRQRVVVEASAGMPPVRLPVRHESNADAVVAELGTLSHDVCLRDALAALVRHFGRRSAEVSA